MSTIHPLAAHLVKAVQSAYDSEADGVAFKTSVAKNYARPMVSNISAADLKTVAGQVRDTLDHVAAFDPSSYEAVEAALQKMKASADRVAAQLSWPGMPGENRDFTVAKYQLETTIEKLQRTRAAFLAGQGPYAVEVKPQADSRDAVEAVPGIQPHDATGRTPDPARG